jgi:hypothetical protein
LRRSLVRKQDLETMKIAVDRRAKQLIEQYKTDLKCAQVLTEMFQESGSGSRQGGV